MPRINVAIARLSVCAALCVPVPAFAQYYLSLAVTPSGPGTCDVNDIMQPVSGTTTANPPDSPNNLFIVYSVNGGPPQTSVYSLPGPFPQTQTPVTLDFNAPGGPFTIPYTIVLTEFPALNGVPTGFGIRATGVCTSTGATVTFENDVAAPVPPTLPTLPARGLAAMSALLAATGLWMTRRRRRIAG